MQYIKHYCTVPCRDIETPTGELKIAIACMSSSQPGVGAVNLKHLFMLANSLHLKRFPIDN